MVFDLEDFSDKDIAEYKKQAQLDLDLEEARASAKRSKRTAAALSTPAAVVPPVMCMTNTLHSPAPPLHTIAASSDVLVAGAAGTLARVVATSSRLDAPHMGVHPLHPSQPPPPPTSPPPLDS